MKTRARPKRARPENASCGNAPALRLRFVGGGRGLRSGLAELRLAHDLDVGARALAPRRRHAAPAAASAAPVAAALAAPLARGVAILACAVAVGGVRLLPAAMRRVAGL